MGNYEGGGERMGEREQERKRNCIFLFFFFVFLFSSGTFLGVGMERAWGDDLETMSNKKKKSFW